MKQNRNILIFGLFFLSILGGCRVGPDYHPIEMEVEEEWGIEANPKTGIVVTEEPAILNWWKVFQDPLLEKYLAWAREYNYDLLIAETNVQVARANRLIAKAAYYPNIQMPVSASRVHLSKNGPFASISTLAGGTTPSLINIIPPFKFIQNLFNIEFDATWEIDIFGQIGRSVEAAEARIQSGIENKNDVLITVYAEIAQNYMQIRGWQKQLELQRQNVEILQQITIFAENRKKSGLDNALELAQAEAQLATAQATIPNLYAQIDAATYSISVLTGHYPEDLNAQLWEVKPLPQTPLILPIGLRSDLLRRRPDIRKAERELAAATADVGVAVANFYPSFTLSADIGLQSQHFKNWFQGRSVDWSETAGANLPIYTGGQTTATVQLYQAKNCQAALQYEKTVLVALQETQGALVKYISEMDRRLLLRESVVSNQYLFKLAKNRYQTGLTNIKTLLDANRDLISVQLQLVDSETTSLIDLISLYKSLGGGWEGVCEELYN